MFKSVRMLTLCAQTPVHAGSGNDMGGVIDLPIQREKHTNFPKFESSSLKGCLREEFNGLEKENFYGATYKSVFQYAFGSDENANSAASMAVTDARCLLFPVTSVKGVFAWVTCPLVIKRFVSDLNMGGFSYKGEIPPENTISVDSELTPDRTSIMLDENVYNVREDENVKSLAEFILEYCSIDALLLQKNLAKRIAVLPDDDFKMIVTMGTEVMFRNRIDPTTGTVAGTALFQEELLPPESVLYALLMTGPIYEKSEEKEKISEAVASSGMCEEDFIMTYLSEKMPSVIQLGGNATLGKGLLAVKVNDR